MDLVQAVVHGLGVSEMYIADHRTVSLFYVIIHGDVVIIIRLLVSHCSRLSRVDSKF